ncbi:MAG TPA: elongation factor P, partial [Candidatus Sulfotelmatobacter sp.]|nr:elongation factor P [Candidatus Sulfotelmatobacter sp.]
APAFIRAKLKNLLTGAITEETLRPEEKLGRARIERVDAVYLYPEGDSYVVMDNSTYDQFPLGRDQIGDAARFLTENQNLTLLQYDGRVIGVELPVAVELQVTSTEPGFKGDTANAASKPATLETGITIDVPLFINEGERIRVDSRNGRYIERA